MTTAYVAICPHALDTGVEVPHLGTIGTSLVICQNNIDDINSSWGPALKITDYRIAHVEIREIPAPDEETRKAMEE